MTPRTIQPRLIGLHQADALVLAVLSSAILALGLLLARELWAGSLNRVELNAVIAAAIGLGLVQLWLSLRAVLALTVWAASNTASPANAPWTLPVWWLGTIPAGWLGQVFPGCEHHPAFLVLSLVITAQSARALTQVVHAAEACSLDAPRR
jgi:hypothetical protein